MRIVLRQIFTALILSSVNTCQKFTVNRQNKNTRYVRLDNIGFIMLQTCMSSLSIEYLDSRALKQKVLNKG